MKVNFLMGLTALCLILITSCEKSNSNADLTPDYALNAAGAVNTEAQDVLIAIEEFEDELLESRDNGPCPTIITTAPKGSFPNTFTIDFGTGCLTKSGRYHQGKIVIEQSDSMNQPGAVRKTTFVEFYIDSIIVKNGTVTLRNESNPGDSNKKFSRTVSNLSFTGAKGTLIINGAHNRTQTAGGTTLLKSDDVWEITGSRSGTYNEEINFTTNIRQALILRGNCPFIVSGIEEIHRADRTVLIDFGDGSCDRFAKGTTENGTQFLIVLRPRF